jgi:AcrR family transcriptional regulator
MPKLWRDTISDHRHDVREAIIDSAGRLAQQEGPLSLSMARVAADVGIGRGTLYKYFPDVEAILRAWHDRHVRAHLTQLAALVAEERPAADRLAAVSAGYARICYFRRQHGTEDLSALLHRDEGAADAERRLHTLFRQLIAEAAEEHAVRRDVEPEELASYCVHALAGAGSVASEAGVARLVAVTLDALRAES